MKRRTRPSPFPFMLLGLALLLIRSPLTFAMHDDTLGHSPLLVETHVHSVFSADAVADVGVLAVTARALGYDAVFLTDHNEGSAFQIQGDTANRRVLDEDDGGWKLFQRGDLRSSTTAMESETAYQGVRAFHLALSTPSTGAVGLWARRGPLIAAGPVILSFAVLVRHLDPESGFAATVTLGGDSDVAQAIGYTTAGGEVLLDRHVTFAWTIGSPVLPTSQPAHRVIVFPLPEPRADEWTLYTVDVTEALAQLAADEQPHPFAAFLHPRFTLSAHDGSADLFLDAVTLEARNPLAPAEEFVARTQLCHAFSSDSFHLFCAHEMGQQRHTIRFDFAIEDPADFTDFRFGTDGIPLAHSVGYPTQLNHPGSTIRLSEILEHRAYGADFIEVRKPEWAALWDELLLREVSLLGSWGTDSHELIDPGNPATFVFASANSLDAIVSALYEGRSFLARNTFTGAFLLSPFAAPQRPYPARYPIFVSDQITATTIFLRITDGIPSDARLRWIRNGTLWREEALSGPGADLAIDLPLEGPLTVLRAELLDRSGMVIAMTQPLVFRDVPGLPPSYRFLTERIDTVTGRDYSQVATRGIVAAEWDPIATALLLTLSAPATARVHLRLETAPPVALDFAGVTLPAPAPTTPFALELFQPAATADLVLAFASRAQSARRPPPSPPQTLTVTAIERSAVTLSWHPPAARDRPLRYQIERNGEPLALVGATTSYRDRSARPSNRYIYTVRAIDLAGTRSPASSPVTVSVPPPIQLADDFETDMLVNWNTVGDVSIQSRSGEISNRALRLGLQSAAAAALRTFPTPQGNFSVHFRFQLLDQGPAPVQLVALTTASHEGTIALGLSSSGRLELRVGSVVTPSQQIITFGVWYHCRLEISPNRVSSATCHDEAALGEPTELLTIQPTETTYSTIVIGQTDGTPRAVVLVDDLVVRSAESDTDTPIRSWAWGGSRARS